LRLPEKQGTRNKSLTRSAGLRHLSKRPTNFRILLLCGVFQLVSRISTSNSFFRLCFVFQIFNIPSGLFRNGGCGRSNKIPSVQISRGGWLTREWIVHDNHFAGQQQYHRRCLHFHDVYIRKSSRKSRLKAILRLKLGLGLGIGLTLFLALAL
jgi:hypothetical protein